MITRKMQTKYDCETIAISYALQIDYDVVDKALSRYKWLYKLGYLINPIIGNPWNVKKALRKLGIHYDEIRVEDIKDEDTIILLIHKGTWPGWRHIFQQHWICKRPFEDWNWGDGLRYHIEPQKLKAYTDCRLYRTILRVTKDNS